MKKILLVCGTGVVTCTLLRKMLGEQLNARGLEGTYEMDQIDAWEVAEKSPQYDLCITTTVLGETCHCPVVMAADFIMGRNRDETVDEICRVLEK